MSERISWVAVGENPDGTTTWFYAFSSKPKADKFVALVQPQCTVIEWTVYPCDHDTPEQAAQYFALALRNDE